MRPRLTFLIAMAFGLASAQTDIPASSFERTFHTAYMYQGIPRYGEAGSEFCAPVATAMGFSWLSENGYPNLLPPGSSKIDSLQRLVEVLASKPYMDTNTAKGGGTSTGEVIQGVVRFAHEAGYSLSDIQYAGWRPVPKDTPGTRVSIAPDFHLVSSGLSHPATIVLVNVGYYDKAGQDGVWRRQEGHWVTVVGYGTTGNGKIDDSALLIHNPARGMPKNLAPKSDLPARLNPDVTRVTPIEGTIEDRTGKTVQMPGPLYAIEGPALPKSRKFDATFVDGILAITFAPPSN